MSKVIKSVLDKYTNVTINRRFVKMVLKYVNDFSHGDEERINFLGSNLIGVFQFKMVEEDRLVWLEDIMGIEDELGLKDAILALDGMHGNNGQVLRVASNVTNHTFLYVAHLALTSDNLSKKESEQLATAAITMLQYRFLSSMHTRFFPHKADEGLAMAVYESLSRKSSIKEYGSWFGLINARTEDILGKRAIWSKVLRQYDDSINAGKALADIQGRLKSVLIKMTDTMRVLMDKESRIRSTGSFITIGDDVILKDKVNNYQLFKDRLHDIIPDKHALIRDDLLVLMEEVLGNVRREHIVEVLSYLSENYNSKAKGPEISELVDRVVGYILRLINEEGLQLDDIPNIVIKLRNMLRSSRVKDSDLMWIKEHTDIIVEEVVRVRSSSVRSATRIALTLYLGTLALLR